MKEIVFSIAVVFTLLATGCSQLPQDAFGGEVIIRVVLSVKTVVGKENAC